MEISASHAYWSLLPMLTQKLKAVLTAQYPDLRVVHSSCTIDIGLTDKGRGLAVVAKAIADRKQVAIEKIYQGTLALGDSENDVPMLNLAAQHGGVAIWVSEARSKNLNAMVAHIEGKQGGRVGDAD